MPERNLRAILLDGHGGLVEKKTASGDPRLVPQEGRAFWAWCVESAVRRELGMAVRVDPMRLWETRCEKELRVPRALHGRTLSQRDYFEWVNRLVVETVLKAELSSVPLRQRIKIARLVRKLHRTDHAEHRMYADGREFVKWASAVGLPLFLQTALEDRRVKEMIARGHVPESRIQGVFTTQRLGASKLQPEFWQRVLKEIRCAPHETLVVGNNVVQDTYCTEVGIPAIVLDRDGVQERYFRERGQELRGAPFLRRSDELPPRAPYIAFERSFEGIKWWCMRMTFVARK